MIPYVTEEVWTWAFAGERGEPSTARRWPRAEELAAVPPPADRDSLALAAAAMSAINKVKTASGASVGRLVTALSLAADGTTLARLRPIEGDVLASVRSRSHELVERPELAPGTFEVLRCELAPPAAAD